MIKCEVIESFTLEKFNQLENVKKAETRKGNEFGVGDTFECDEKMVDYLTGNNALNKTVVKVIEIIPEVIIDEEKVKKTVVEEKPKKKKSSKK